MAYAKAVAQCIINRPDADGRLTTMGLGRDWIAGEIESGLQRFTPDVSAGQAWDLGGRFEYIEALRAIGPTGDWTRADMVMSEWEDENGTAFSALNPDTHPWELSGTAGNLLHRHLWFYDATPDATGLATSVASIEPNFVAWVKRMPHVPGSTAPSVFAIILNYGSALPTYALAWPQYAQGQSTATLPLDSGVDWTAPMLWGKAPGESYITPIAEIGSGLSTSGDAQGMDVIRVQYDAGHLLVRHGQDSDGFAFGGKWTSNGGAEFTFELIAAQVRIGFLAHCGMFNLQRITYPASIVLKPTNHFIVPANLGAGAIALQQTPQYKLIADVATGVTGMTVAQDGAGTLTRPAVTFTSAGTRRTRPLLYCVQEHRDAVIGAAVSSPVNMADVTNFKVTSLSGRVDDSWRGATCNASVVNLNPAVNMATLHSNGKFLAGVSDDDGAEFHRQFTGYVTPPEKGRQGGQPGWVDGRFSAEDIVTARLSNKQLLWQPSFQGNGYTGTDPWGSPWSIVEAFNHILHCAGVPDALIVVHPVLATEARMGADYWMPCGTLKGEKKLEFRPDTTVTAALDQMVPIRTYESATNPGKRLRLRWGVNENGIVFLTGEYVHEEGQCYLRTTDRGIGAADDGWNINADTATVENWPLQFRSTRSLSEFANLLWILAGEGKDAAAQVLVDEESLSDAASHRFIGDLWTRFHWIPDLSDNDHLQQVAANMWDELLRQNWLIRVTLDHHPEIMPDDECKVTGCSDIDINDNSIFQIVGKQWDLSGNGRFSQTFDAVMVEEGA